MTNSDGTRVVKNNYGNQSWNKNSKEETITNSFRTRIVKKIL